MKPWLLAILRNVCNAEFARRSKRQAAEYDEAEPTAGQLPIWQEPQASPESVLVAQHDAAAMRRLVEALPSPFREVIVLREMNELSYKEIAEVTRMPIGTVMSRLWRARRLLAQAARRDEAA